MSRARERILKMWVVVDRVMLVVVLSIFVTALKPAPGQLPDNYIRDTVVANTQKITDLQRQVGEHHSQQDALKIPEQLAVHQAAIIEINYKLDRLLYLVLSILGTMLIDVGRRVLSPRKL